MRTTKNEDVVKISFWRQDAGRRRPSLGMVVLLTSKRAKRLPECWHVNVHEGGLKILKMLYASMLDASSLRLQTSLCFHSGCRFGCAYYFMIQNGFWIYCSVACMWQNERKLLTQWQTNKVLKYQVPWTGTEVLLGLVFCSRFLSSVWSLIWRLNGDDWPTL